MGPLQIELGWFEEEDEDGGSSYSRTQLRPLILSAACDAGDKNSLSIAGQMFLAWKDNNVPISSDLRAVVYKYGMCPQAYI